MNYDYKASVLKRIELDDDVDVEKSGHKPQSGDVVAVRITEKRGNYGEVDLPGGELEELEEGDIVLGAFGNRAGVKGYIGRVPDRIEKSDDVFFIGSGGIFGEYVSATKELGLPYRAEFLGYVAEDDKILNTKEYGIDHRDELGEEPRLLPVVATRMDAGKTTVASELIQKLDGRGYKVGSVKLTGSARERDRVSMYDAGSLVSLDFVDAGLPSTVEDPDEVIDAAKGLIHEAWNAEDVDMIVAEFGAGVISNYHVMDVLKDLDVRKTVFAIASTALDVSGAYGLKKILQEQDYELDMVCGPITDTTAGVEKVEDSVGVEALNAFRDEDMEEAANIIEERFEEL
ncbi:MAG: hypothetical protein SV186_04670 [Candidatus Nanohaloarchaea archaeon]|nr:hypothetical protein [Candidatus Nanohaloarchaea archaeon]